MVVHLAYFNGLLRKGWIVQKYIFLVRIICALVKWNLPFLSALGRRDSWREARRGKSVDGCGLVICFSGFDHYLSLCWVVHEYYVWWWQKVSYSLRVLHRWSTVTLIVSHSLRTKRPLVLCICRSFDAFLKHQTHLTHAEKLIQM